MTATLVAARLDVILTGCGFDGGVSSEAGREEGAIRSRCRDCWRRLGSSCVATALWLLPPDLRTGTDGAIYRAHWTVLRANRAAQRDNVSALQT